MSQTPFDSIYFSSAPWKDRVQNWLSSAAPDAFFDGNHRLIRQILEHPDSGLRMVINISAEALLGFLAKDHYYNLYERPVIGGSRKSPSKEREDVDQLLGFGVHPETFYFGAVALGGTGVRFCGEYCVTLDPKQVDKDTKILDRDSYDLLMPPLAEDAHTQAKMAKLLAGKWDADAIDMLTLKLLPDLRGTNRLITTGTVSEMVLHDREFVEVHREGDITRTSIEEVRQSPDEFAIESHIEARGSAGFSPTMTELRWLEHWSQVVQALERYNIPSRVVTLHGRGYQWR